MGENDSVRSGETTEHWELLSDGPENPVWVNHETGQEIHAVEEGDGWFAYAKPDHGAPMDRTFQVQLTPEPAPLPTVRYFVDQYIEEGVALVTPDSDVESLNPPRLCKPREDDEQR